MIAVAFGILGLIIGSFLNVVVLRKGARSLQGRSACMSCGYQLAWYDMIPVLSWLMLGGRCRKCGSAVSMQYPLVEASTGILFAMIGAWAAPILLIIPAWPLIAAYLCICALLICIAAYDLLHTIIPDGWVYSFVGLAFAAQFMAPLPAEIPWLQFAIGGPLAAAPLFVLWLVSGGRWMGFGDVKLALGIGWLLGTVDGSIAVMFSFILGTFILIPWMLVQSAITHMREYGNAQRGLTMKSEVPFGPFLVGSCLIIWFFHLFGFPLPLPF